MKLVDAQLNKMADIASDLGLIAIASVVLPAILEGFRPLFAVLGTVVALTFWIISLALLTSKETS